MISRGGGAFRVGAAAFHLHVITHTASYEPLWYHHCDDIMWPTLRQRAEQVTWLSTWNKCVSDTLALVRRDTQTHTRVHSTTLWQLLIGPLSHSPVCTTCPRSLFVSCQQQRWMLDLWSSMQFDVKATIAHVNHASMVTFALLKLKLVSCSNRAETSLSALAFTPENSWMCCSGSRSEGWNMIHRVQSHLLIKD